MKRKRNFGSGKSKYMYSTVTHMTFPKVPKRFLNANEYSHIRLVVTHGVLLLGNLSIALCVRKEAYRNISQQGIIVICQGRSV